MKDLTETIAEIKEVCMAHAAMEERLMALKQAGYENIEYRYLKGAKLLIQSHYSGLYEVSHLPNKHLFRIQVGYTELKKGYPAAWCVDVSSQDVMYAQELPF